MSIFATDHLLGRILEFVNLSDLEDVSTTSKAFAEGARVRRGKVLSVAFTGKAFGERKIEPKGPIAVRSALIPPVVEAEDNSSSEGNDEVPTAVASPAPPTFYPTLSESFKSLYNLRRLDLIACRLTVTDFRNSLKAVSGTLVELRIEMIRTIPDKGMQQMGRDLQEGRMHMRSAGVGLERIEVMVEMAGEDGDAPIVMKNLRRLDLSPPTTSVLNRVQFPKLARLSSYRKMLEDKCSYCKAPRPSSKCGACKFYAFCAKECQEKNWKDTSIGHSRVCVEGEEVDSPRRVSNLIETAARAGELRELDLAHYWQTNILFPAGALAASAAAVGDDEDEAVLNRRAGGSVLPVFARPVVVNVLDRLVTLRLLRCGLDDNSLFIIGKNSRCLRALDITANTKITNDGLRHLTLLASTLVDLCLRQNYRLTDEGLRSSLIFLPKLVNLDLRTGIRRLRRGGADTNFSVLWTPTYATLKAIATHCTQLHRLRLLAIGLNGVPAETGVSFLPSRVNVELDNDGFTDMDSWGSNFEELYATR